METNPVNLLSAENLEKARRFRLDHQPVAAFPTNLDLPSPQQLEDARWQLDYAGKRLAVFVTTMREALQKPPANNDAARIKHERNLSFLRALDFYFTANTNLLALLDQREEEMGMSMAEADFAFRQMRLSRDFNLHEVRVANRRYYQENDLAAKLDQLFPLDETTPLQP